MGGHLSLLQKSNVGYCFNKTQYVCTATIFFSFVLMNCKPSNTPECFCGFFLTHFQLQKKTWQLRPQRESFVLEWFKFTYTQNKLINYHFQVEYRNSSSSCPRPIQSLVIGEWPRQGIWWVDHWEGKFLIPVSKCRWLIFLWTVFFYSTFETFADL